MRIYLVVNVARAGSTFFCSLLRASGVLGHPRQYFTQVPKDISAIEAWHRISQGLGLNGVCGNKSNLPDTEVILRWIDPEAIIHFRRRDVLGQAISYVRAVQSKQWMLKEDEPVNQAVQYDFEQLQQMVAMIEEQNQAIIDRYRPGMTLYYEDLMSNPQNIVGRVARRMRVRIPEPAALKSSIRIQRDEVTVQWRQRFQSEAGQPTSSSPQPAAVAPTSKS
jgi:LPS sulfotransferase NodH